VKHFTQQETDADADRQRREGMEANQFGEVFGKFLSFGHRIRFVGNELFRRIRGAISHVGCIGHDGSPFCKSFAFETMLPPAYTIAAWIACGK
jgi:hypothetical protein